MRYGHFDDAAREYVIERPDTPLPWINYLGRRDLFAIVSNSGGGYTFFQDARLRRLTRYRYHNAPADLGGRALYVRLPDGDFWSPTWQPARRDLDSYECRHGVGYTRIRSDYRNVGVDILYFIPLDDPCEVWWTTLTNQGSEPAALQLYGAVEFCLWDAWDDQTNFQRNLNIGEVEVHADRSIIYHRTEYRERRNHFAYFACSMPVAGFDTDRDRFLGPYRGWDNPLAVCEGACRDSVAHGWAPMAAYQVNLLLAPGQSRQIAFVLGYCENPSDRKFLPGGELNDERVHPVLARYRDAAQIEMALDELREDNARRLSICQVETPDVDLNRMLNTWTPYQALTTFNLARSASLFESGIGRGIGFRDACQDLLGFVHLDRERACRRLLDLAGTQLPDGGAYHQYQPLTQRGNETIGSGFNDDPLWLVLAAAAYVKETGDSAVLDHAAPYDNQRGSEADLYDHLRRALSYTLARLGPHGLPLIGHADWNDCLNLNCFSSKPGQSFQTHTDAADGKVAESVFIAALFVLAAREMAALADFIGRGADGMTYRAQADEMERTVLRDGWDGAWFLRAYDHFGAPIGSATCEEGRVFVETQGLCVMAGIGLDNDLARSALDSVERYLATPHGIVLQQPAYTRYYLNLGEISSYPPGYKENAGVFCHTNPWVAIAECRLGRAERALDYYRRINPSVREPISDVHRCEPYVYAQMIAGRDAPTFGEAKNSWLTGAAAWNLVAATQWILGIRPAYAGLQIQPCIPAEWPGFTVTRVFRGVVYRIDVRRSGPGHQASLVVDGRPVAGSVVPPPDDGRREVHVQVDLT